MPFCRSCGEKNPDASLFCTRCGYQLRPLSEEVTRQSNPSTTNVPPADAPTFLTPPLQSVPINNAQKKEEDEEEERLIIPPIIPPQVSAAGNVPSVAGAPQIGTVPSVPGGAGSGMGSAATTLTAGTIAKVVVVLAICAAVIFAAVKVVPPILAHQTSTSTTGVSGKATTVPVPPTQTSCPQGGTARASVTRTLVLGTHQELVYVENSGKGNTATGTLWRYDITTHQKVRLIQIANGDITYAQLSADGQWVSFVSNVYGQPQGQGVWEPLYSRLQMIRVDGQGLQTLYCSASTTATGSPSAIVNMQWSPDQRSFVFVEQFTSTVFRDYYPAYLHVLNAASGTVQKLSTFVGAGPPKLAWLDNTHLYMLVAGQAAPEGIYLLDITSGGNPSKIFPNTTFTGCLDFAGGYDGSKLFISQCAEYVGQVAGTGAPSSITARPATGGTPTTVFATATFAIRSISAVTKTSLLLLVENQGSGMNNDGLWKINMDGTGLTQLTSDPVRTGDPTMVARLNGFSKYPWANVSRDGRWYALQQNQTLIFGSMNGGPSTSFATMAGSSVTYFSNGQPNSGIVGWTSM
jgi:hypothetical protein